MKFKYFEIYFSNKRFEFIEVLEISGNDFS